MPKTQAKTMHKTKKASLSRAGWKVGSAAEFLELTPEESILIEMKLALAECLKAGRLDIHWTQSQVARQLGSSQSRVAKMEAGDTSVSLDLLVRAILALGASQGRDADHRRTSHMTSEFRSLMWKYLSPGGAAGGAARRQLTGGRRH